LLSFSRLAKRFPNGHLALEGLDLEVAPGEILAIVGSSGCGKSTLLRLASGLDLPSEGGVFLKDEPVTAPRPEIGLLFQEPRLLPWLTIRGNVGFGLRHLATVHRRIRVDEALARVGLSGFADHWPRELSGGMAQRVAIARALVGRPSVLLLDEPFSALDALTRYDLQQHLLEVWGYDRPTLVLVTHDIEEALFLSDRVVVMRGQPGRIHAVLTLDLPRPRDRGDAALLGLKRRLLAELEVSVQAAPPAARGDAPTAELIEFKRVV
jgi:sulfonate transport system ATP-binding protein